jgi:hypothetical protein
MPVPPKIVCRYGPQGGPVWGYRGALIETGDRHHPGQNYLRLAGHPCDGMRFASPSSALAIIDAWAEAQSSADAA